MNETPSSPGKSPESEPKKASGESSARKTFTPKVDVQPPAKPKPDLAKKAGTKSEAPTAGGTPKEPEPKKMSKEPAVSTTPITPKVEVQPPIKSSTGPAQNLPAAQRQGWVSRVLGGNRQRRDQQIQTLQSGYVEMLDMMRSISGHLDRQAQSQDQLMKTLDHFPDAVEGLRNVGKATEQQTEVLAMVRDQLETNADHEREITKSMDGFNKTLNLMDETSRNTASTIGDLVESSRDSEDELRAMLERSEKRLTMLTAVLGVIGLLAIGSAIYVGLSQRQIQPTPPSSTAPEPTSTEPASETDPLATLPELDPVPEPGPETDPFASPPEMVPIPEGQDEDPSEDPFGADDPTDVPPQDTDIEVEMPALLDDAEAVLIEPVVEGEADAESTDADPFQTMDSGESEMGEPKEASEDTMDDAEEEPAGVKNVVKDFFSFLGDEEDVDAEEGMAEEATEEGGEQIIEATIEVAAEEAAEVTTEDAVEEATETMIAEAAEATTEEGAEIEGDEDPEMP